MEVIPIFQLKLTWKGFSTCTCMLYTLSHIHMCYTLSHIHMCYTLSHIHMCMQKGLWWFVCVSHLLPCFRLFGYKRFTHGYIAIAYKNKPRCNFHTEDSLEYVSVKSARQKKAASPDSEAPITCMLCKCLSV